MASLNLAPEELKQLELLRNRFAQLQSSLTSLAGNLIRTEPLPTYESLQASASILQQNLRSIQELMTENSDIFKRIAIHPSTNFPGRTQEHMLLQLLRKKLEPEVESWVEEARETARAAGIDVSKLSGPGGGAPTRGMNGYGDDDEYGLDDEDEGVPSDPFNEQWADMLETFQHSLHHYVTVQLKKQYTVEEQEMGIENVRTGLKRELGDEDEDEDEDEEEEEEGVAGVAGGAASQGAGAGTAGAAAKKPVIQPEYLFWLAARGDTRVSRNIEFEAMRKVAQTAKRPAPPR